MPGWSPILWAKQTAKDRSGAATLEQLLNCFVQKNPAGSPQPFKILPIPGLKYWSNYGAGPIRGTWYALGRLFVVSGNELYVVASDKSSVMIGAVPGGGPVHMMSNETHVGIATNLGFYAATTAAIVNVDGVHYSTAVYQNGYGILSEFGTDRWFLTGLDDMTTIDPLDYTNADELPDKLKGNATLSNEVYAFGEKSAERYYLSGDQYFPFTKISGGAIPVGCISGDSIVTAQKVIGWLAEDYSAHIVAGGQEQLISTPGIEKWIGARLNPSDVRGVTYRLEGHESMVWNWQDGSIAYDLSNGLWHERKSWAENRWRVDTCSDAFGKKLVGDFESGNVYELDPNTVYEENGAGVKEWIVRTMQPGPITSGADRVFMDELYIDCEMGVGLGVPGTGFDPKWSLQWSDDDGNTWSNIVEASAGKSGEYALRATFNRLGSFTKSRTLRLMCSDPVRMAVCGAFARLGVGDA